MTLQDIIEKWERERSRIREQVDICEQNKFLHEKDLLSRQDAVIREILLDLKFKLDKRQR